MQVITQTTKGWLKNSIVLWTVVATIAMLTGAYFMAYANRASAAAMTSVKVTLETSAPSAASNHEISFTLDGSTAWDAGDTVTLTVETAGQTFDLSALSTADPNDYDITVGATEETIVAAGNCATTDAIEINDINTTTDVITFTACGSYTAEAAGSAVVIEIGDNATSGATGDSKITNPAKVNATEGDADTYFIDIGGTVGDTGTAMVAIVEGVAVNVTVQETLDLDITEETNANCGTATDLTGTDHSDDSGHTNIVIDFGTPSGNSFHYACQDITVSTNGSNGYTTTVEKTQLLTSGSNTIPDGNCDGTCSDTASAGWATASNNGFGYCLMDTTGDPAVTSDADDDAGTNATDWVAANQCDGGDGNGGADTTPFFKTFGTLTPEPIMKSYSPASADEVRMGVVLSVPGDQAAGSYTTTLTYIATPTF